MAMAVRQYLAIPRNLLFRAVADKRLTVYLGGRFLVGFGNSLAQLSCPVLLTEICHPQHRAIVSAIYNCLWNLGATRE
jgi:MFS family permease